jgi:hypothetical protein
MFPLNPFRTSTSAVWRGAEGGVNLKGDLGVPCKNCGDFGGVHDCSGVHAVCCPLTDGCGEGDGGGGDGDGGDGGGAVGCAGEGAGGGDGAG